MSAAYLHRIAPLGFLFLVMVKSWVMPVLYLDYELRREFIIQNYCVNKNRPQLQCNGKCYLSKRMEAARQQEESKAEQNFIFKLLDISADCPGTQGKFFGDGDEAFMINTVSHYAYEDLFLFKNITTDIFHPPLG